MVCEGCSMVCEGCSMVCEGCSMVCVTSTHGELPVLIISMHGIVYRIRSSVMKLRGMMWDAVGRCGI